MNKTCLALGTLILSNLTIELGNIEDDVSFKLDFNNANADTEVITVWGTRYTPPAYENRVLTTEIFDNYGGGDTSPGNDWGERLSDAISEFCDLQPDGCNTSSLPSDLPLIL